MNNKNKKFFILLNKCKSTKSKCFILTEKEVAKKQPLSKQKVQTIYSLTILWLNVPLSDLMLSI